MMAYKYPVGAARRQLQANIRTCKAIVNILVRKASYTTGRQFAVARRPPKWYGLGIFGASFGLGWLITQHLSYADLMAWLFYDQLPADDEKVRNYQAGLLQRAHELPATKDLFESGFRQVFPERGQRNVLINQTLRRPGALSIEPLFFYNPKTKTTVGIYHLGMRLTGYPFLVHGGILATVLSDLMREAVTFVTGTDYEVTEHIKISYCFPTLANQFVVVRTTRVEDHGNNVRLEAEIINQSGTRTLVRAKGSFTTG
ncbi:ADL386Wp [Eremothecium gossypii ATCC 10895]|uniref:ADL386Wp n=1 Tax=Eremothecium gossypii (strain ATCC 10895 / CBS 109.51 / FGSC 9923 / NRRL Y-1056) TaxID=284811 RepID=Q75BF0_EREGS|nr:ADL386Wp [Eremothecium gossypii ATCC 10895]AAS51534.1 ADL386Wp [Eremothecium gossypii ATCC 10895]AEY95830.1 FADL386Wp [Eremothecium gossypii FDAG1]